MTAQLDAALKYAARGWPVFGLAPRSKKPIAGTNGAADASTEPGVIREMWRRTPDANVGLTCATLLIVDVDLYKPEGQDWLAKHRDKLRGITLTATTARGGVHLLFQIPPGELRGVLAPGVDLRRGRNHYVVAAPSVTADGAYTWVKGWPAEPAPMPSWLLELCRPVPSAMPTPSAGIGGRDHNRIVERAERYVRCVDPAVQGSGGSKKTFAVCLSLLSRFPELSNDEVWNLLVQWNATCQPPWSARELAHKLEDATRSVRGGRAA